MEPNMLVSPRDDFQWQWECGECDSTKRGFGTKEAAQQDAQQHWAETHEED